MGAEESRKLNFSLSSQFSLLINLRFSAKIIKIRQSHMSDHFFILLSQLPSLSQASPLLEFFYNLWLFLRSCTNSFVPKSHINSLFHIFITTFARKNFSHDLIFFNTQCPLPNLTVTPDFAAFHIHCFTFSYEKDHIFRIGIM